MICGNDLTHSVLHSSNPSEMNTNVDTEGRNGNHFISRVVLSSLVPTVLFLFYFNDGILLEIFQLLLISYFVVVLIVPLIFKFNYAFQRSVVFLHIINFPRFAKYKQPESHGLTGTRNFYLKTDENIYLGIWHILPENLIKDNLPEEDKEEYFEKTLSHGQPVFVYMHGNSSNRAAGHHILLHKILRKRFHVITFDYRGYGDSTGLPVTEHLVITDAIAILRWVKRLTTAPILVWGHSLGTAVATHALRLLTDQNDCFVQGLVLESPFDNMRNEVCEHPMTMIFRNLPWFRYLVVDAIYNSGFLFASDDHIKHVNCPILMLHAEDDWVVPFKLGFELYCTASKNRKPNQGPIQFKKFPKMFGCGHKYICRAPEIPSLIKNFVDQCLEK